MKQPEIKIEYLAVDALQPYGRNARKHGNEDVQAIVESIKEFGFNDPIGLWSDKNIIVEGHGRLLAAKLLNMEYVPCIRLDHLTDEQRRGYALAHNKTAELSKWDDGMLDIELGNITGIDMGLFGFEKTVAEKEEEAKQTLAEAFIVPPLSILDVKQPYWQERKKAWKVLISDNGQARGDGQDLYASRNNFVRKLAGKDVYHSGSSVLDPVLCEVLLTWFCPTEGKISTFDCFAGDAVFGFVSSYLGHEFTGIELRQEQVDFNRAQCEKHGLTPNYICDDGRNIASHLDRESQDFFFSCPPYFDMEVYSDKPNDASNQKNYAEFYKIIDEAFSGACACLKKNRFACVCIQDVRSNKGGYYGFPEDIIATFRRNGFQLYNRIIMLRSIGSAALFARKTFQGSRKVRNVHEDVLVFYNGDEADLKPDLPEEEIVDAFYAEFLRARQNVPAFRDVLVFFNGNTPPKDEFKPIGEKKNEGKDMA